MATTAFDLYRANAKTFPARGPGPAFAAALLPAFQSRLAVLADADWRSVVGARDQFSNLSTAGKLSVEHLCTIGRPSAQELMSALAAATHQR